MRLKLPLCLLVFLSFWTNLFAPFVTAQNPANLPQNQINGLGFRLTEAPRKDEIPLTRPKISVENLSAAEADEILKRLPSLPAETEDTTAFKLRGDTIKPPKSGNLIPVKFPSDEKRKKPETSSKTAETLRVEQYSPTGKTPFAVDLSVKFSQPMVAVSSQTQASENVPVELKPEVKGRWRWLGTDTLIFDADERFPMATAFTAKIPKGTKSVNGAKLERDFSWTFTTPPATIEKFVPQNENAFTEIFPEYTIMAAKFNQAIDEKDILSKITVTAGGKRFPIKSVTAEVNPSYIAYQSLGETKPKHWLAFRTVETLPLNSTVIVRFEKGLPSAEGDGKSEAEQVFTFKTLPPFKYVKHFCGYYENQPICEPSNDFRIQFNHSLYSAAFEPGQIKIEPEIEDAKIVGQGNTIYIQGKKKPNTTYKITVSGGIRDYYKQTPGNDLTVYFNVGTEQKQFFALGGKLLTLDPFAGRVFSVYSKNHASFKVRLYVVAPEDFFGYRQLLYEYRNSDRRIAPTPRFGKLIFNKTVEVNAEPDALTETRIDLSEALPNNFGHVILISEPTDKSARYDDRNLPVVAWVQATEIGIDALIDYEKLTAFVSDLKTGKPLAGAAISLHRTKDDSLNAVADNRGLADFNFMNDAYGYLLAKNGMDSAILGETDDYAYWRKQGPYELLRWHVFDDRKMYRPNEEVFVKGYLRKVTTGTNADIAELGEMAKKVTYILRDPRAGEIARGTIPVNAFGAFDFKVKLPDNINLGYQRLEFWTGENVSGYRAFEHTFRVEEFRRPEFEVSVEAETPAPYFVGNSAVLSAEAKYYTGGALSASPLKWTISAALTNYSPPGNETFTFGEFIPWWRHLSEELPRNSSYFYPSQKLDGTTDASGKHRVNLDFTAANPARPYTLRAIAEITDVNRQNIADTKNFLIHPSEVYVGLRSPKTFVRQGEPLKVEAIATDIDGKRVAGAPVEIKAVLKDWIYAGGNSQEVVIDTQTCSLTSAEQVVSCDFPVKQGGRFTITATVLDARERPNTSEMMVWAAGGTLPPKRGVEMETVELIPDKKQYAPGETAEILVNAPFYPAEGVMTLERSGIVRTERFTMNEPATVLQIPIEERFLPNIFVKVDLTGATERTNDNGEIDRNLPKRPAFASGELNLEVSTASRRLTVAVEPSEKTTEPGKETRINIEVKDHLGAPAVETEVAVIAVDEGVLALSDYKIQNPLDAFYQPIAAGVAHYRSREKVVLGNPKDTLSRQQIENLPVLERRFSALMTDGVSLENSDKKSVYKSWIKNDVAYIITESEKSAISIRRNFDALAIFSPSVRTDSNGKATVSVKLPDNLTRYRITAVAVTKSKQFGLGESSITARQDLQVRPSAPRFMNFGDKAELPVVLQNQSDQPLTVAVAVRGANARLLDGNGRRVTIPANDRAEIRFPVAVEAAGTARFQVGAVSGNLADAAEFAFPVYIPASSETFATYGTTDASGAILQSVKMPKNVFPEFGGLEITTSSTQLQELTDAFIYVYGYSFGCTEQVSSRVLSIAALRDVLQAFKSKEMPTAEEIETQMRYDIERLRQLQHYDGGFSFWSANDASIPYVSAHVAHALARAKQKGYRVPDEMIGKSLGYLKTIESKFPEEYSEESRLAIAAYALYVRDLLGEKDSAKAKKMIAENGLEKLGVESAGWLLSVLADDKTSVAETEEIKRFLMNRTTETSAAAHFVTRYRDGEYVLLASERRADAVILEAFLKAEPNNPLIPKIVRGLLAARTKGRWSNTQENAFVLLALDKYFHVYEKVTPDFVARIWLGQTFAGEQKFAGRSADSNLVNVPMQFLQQTKDAKNLTLDKQGAGRLYYRIGMKYASKNLKLDAADYGFVVSRAYEAVDNPADVRQNSDGSWTIKSGARIRVRLQMVAPAVRYHVALVDNLPAGLEIINPTLAVSGDNNIYESPEIRRRYYWFQHQNFRDNRAEAFTMMLREGVWNYTYLARATTPGNYIVPPAKAEEMYTPETFGRSKTNFVKIE